MSDRSMPNPWLSSAPKAPTPQPASAPAPGAVPLAPPAAPAPAAHRQIGAVPLPNAPLGAHPWPPQATVSWWALGAHGGAGVSTLLRTMAGGADALRRWPDVQGAPGGVHVLLVARTDARGLDAAQQAVQEWAGGLAPRSTDIVGLALLADAPGKLPSSLRDRIRLLSGVVTRIWQIPWIPELRELQPPRRPVKELAELAEFLRSLSPPPAVPALPPATAQAPPAAWGSPRAADGSVYASPPPAPPAPTSWTWPTSSPSSEGFDR